VLSNEKFWVRYLCPNFVSYLYNTSVHVFVSGRNFGADIVGMNIFVRTLVGTTIVGMLMVGASGCSFSVKSVPSPVIVEPGLGTGSSTVSPNPPQPLGDWSEVKVLADSVVGLEFSAAVSILEDAGLVARVVERDGVPLMVTQDYLESRVNLVLDGGKVVKTTVG